MRVRFEAKFAKDLRAINNSKHFGKLEEVIETCKVAHNLSDINQLKKLQGYDNFYRIRLGDYRVGIEVVDGEIIFTRFLHRKDIYKYFPR